MVQYVNINKTLDVKYGDSIDRETSLKLDGPVTYNRNASVFGGEEQEDIGGLFTYKFKKISTLCKLNGNQKWCIRLTMVIHGIC